MNREAIASKVCFDARMLWHGGIGTYIRNLLPSLKAAFSSLQVIVHPKMLQTEKWLEDYDLILSSAPIYSIREQIDFFLKVPKVDLFFSPHYNIPLTFIRAKKRVVTIHDVFHLTPLSPLRWHEKIYAKIMLHQAVNRSDAIFTVSQFSAGEICRYTGLSQKLGIIHLGVDRTIFHNRDVSSSVVLPAHYFLFVGNSKPHKNLEGGLLAFKEFLLQTGLDFFLVIVGKFEKVQLTHGLEGRVLVFSEISNEDLASFYRRAEALVFPSFYEGFGLPPLEAMHCGCPVIASRRASLPEVCGSSALYVSPDQPGEMAAAMKKIVEDRKYRDGLIEAGYKNLERFNLKESNERHIQPLRECLQS